eukprot:TRINITY_DN2675_c0_g1_i28.p1 TRINITY_DN2675_c0_g1~~TRINITY_DN2675_c0_g1_i28.p1  ORF type:complete len:179 (+),score=14.95 TRINITY_DN2675_c0_g1_i28:619-1155(+)
MGDFDSLSSKQKFEQKNRILRSYVMAVRRSLNGSPSKSATILVDNLPQELPKFPPYVLIFAPRGTTVPCPPPTCITIWLNATKKKVNLKTSMHTELTCNAPPPPPPVDETFVIPDEPVLAVSTNLKRNCAALVKKLPYSWFVQVPKTPHPIFAQDRRGSEKCSSRSGECICTTCICGR